MISPLDQQSDKSGDRRIIENNKGNKYHERSKERRKWSFDDGNVVAYVSTVSSVITMDGVEVKAEFWNHDYIPTDFVLKN